MGNEKAFTIEKSDFGKLLDQFLKTYRVFGPTSRGFDASFEEIKSNDQLFMDYASTILPPKKFFHPPQIELFSFNLSKKDQEIVLQIMQPDRQVLRALVGQRADVHILPIAASRQQLSRQSTQIIDRIGKLYLEDATGVK